MRTHYIGAISSEDWSNIIQDAIKTIPTIFQRPPTVSPYQTASYALPGPATSTQNQNMPMPPVNNAAQPSTGLNMTTILLFGAAGLVAFKLLKKK